MIIGQIHKGSGLGNQLHRYVATRVLALDKGFDFGFIGIENFKGKEFLKLDWGKEFIGKVREWQEKKVVENAVDIRGYDPEINFVGDNMVIDGEFQDERYFEHRLPEISEWLKVEPMEFSDNLCVINFRGGEYVGIPELFLTKDYWDSAVQIMLDKYDRIAFEVHTDDVATAKIFFPNFPVYSGMAFNWKAIRYAKHLIISNSSFAILPALLNENVKEIIAPRYWARRNTGVWALPQNYYKKFTYI